MNFHVLTKTWPGVEGSRPRTETAYIPTERASKMMNIDVEFISFDELGALPLAEGEGCEALSSRHVGSHGITQLDKYENINGVSS